MEISIKLAVALLNKCTAAVVYSDPDHPVVYVTAHDPEYCRHESPFLHISFEVYGEERAYKVFSKNNKTADIIGQKLVLNDSKGEELELQLLYPDNLLGRIPNDSAHKIIHR